jgi:hypothetical protein
VELPFRINLLPSRKLSIYELPAISKQQNVSSQTTCGKGTLHKIIEEPKITEKPVLLED